MRRVLAIVVGLVVGGPAGCTDSGGTGAERPLPQKRIPEKAPNPGKKV